ncbi:hypothetical protein BDZ91DRAFT_648164 [Kalaharituber pfeilii]|nr:hypothetical protein BDZ91DRAFT_648164 [Kalaharituber pfeilii]
MQTQYGNQDPNSRPSISQSQYSNQAQPKPQSPPTSETYTSTFQRHQSQQDAQPRPQQQSSYQQYSPPSRYQQQNHQDKTTGGFQRRDDHSRHSPRQQDYDRLYSRFDREQPAERSKSKADKAEVIEQEAPAKAVDSRRKKADKDRDKGKRAFGVHESFLLEDEEAIQAKKEKKKQKREKPIPILLPQFISVTLLANSLKVPLDRFLVKLQELGFEDIGYNHVLSAEDAGLVAMEYNYEPIVDTAETQDLLPRPEPVDRSLLPPRPPVVTIMGHVDHGKTTLLDYLRKSSIAASEHGGITQHIGAFSVNMPSGKTVTFLDTPGHAAFLSMRERGANVTDIVILVVAADDSVMPQTLEAIKHAKSANVPMIVAMNKIDKESADTERVKQDLARYGVEIEDIGGDVQVIPVSAKTGQGMEDLEEATLALAEILDMRAETDGPCEGWVLEATTKKRGRVATILVRRGTLRPGDIVVAGKTWARVRNLLNEAGTEVSEAGPGTPVEIDGWKDQPEAGDLVIQAESEEKAKDVVEYRLTKAERLRQAADMEAINESRRLQREKDEQEKLAEEDPEAAEAAAAAAEEAKPKDTCQTVLFIVKADVSGSVEAVINAITSIGNNEVKAKVVRSSFGAVTEFDVDHAAAAEAIILSFNLPLDAMIAGYARAKGVPIMQSTIIYRLVEDVKAKLSEKLAPAITHRVTGEAEILQVFNFTFKKKIVPIAGCRVRLGSVTKGSKVKIKRKGEVIHDGILTSLKNVKLDVDEIKAGTECGIGFENFKDIQAGDLIQCYNEIIEPRFLQ